MSIVLPGHVLDDPPTRIGPGLFPSGHPPVITALRAGLLLNSSQTNAPTHPSLNSDATSHSTIAAESKRGTAYIDSSTKRYIPAPNDGVIGIVTARFADGYRLDLGAALSATLDSLAFENVNRKSRPNIPVSGLVYARTTAVVPGSDIDVVCVTADQKSGGFGVLSGGYLFTVSLGQCRRLLHKSDVTLRVMGEAVEYEVIVGLNGRIWVSSESRKLTLTIAQLIKDVEFCTEGETRALIAKRLRDV